MSAEETANATAGATEVAPEDEGFRVHIGNLSFKATEEQIKEYASSAGEIVSVTLPLKFGRPSGFAFVNYKTEAQANEAVEKLNDGELDGRKVTFAIARSREEQAARRESIIAKRQAAKEAREALKKEKADQAAADGTAVEDGEAEAKPKKKKSAKRTSRRRVPGEEGEEGDTTAVDATETDGAVTEDKPKKSKRKPSKAREARIDGAAEGDTSAEKPVKEKREPRPKLELSDKQSENTIFVANLPFTLDDEGLAAVFTNLSIEVAKATVVTRMRRGRGGKAYRTSRGFGFVEIANSAQQKEAVEKVEGSLIGERVLSAKIAQEMKEREVQEAAEASKEKPAEASEGAADATATA